MEYQVDATGLKCPEPVMMLHAAIRKASLGDVICLTATDPSTQRDVAKFCDFLGYKLLEHHQDGTRFLYRIKKAGSVSQQPLGEALVRVFNRVFQAEDATILCGGAAEPYYEPGALSVIYFREDFDRSALHEVAHWCVAGSVRRGLPDYGYWYAPDGRNAEQQSAFYRVEVKPQAIEALFCEAADLPFAVSVDNLRVDANCPEIIDFKAAVDRQIVRFRQQGLPDRARRFNEALTLLAAER